jgi:amino acid transporter
VIYAALVLLFSIGADFRWNAILGAVSRLFIYGCVALALPALRKKQPNVDAFRLPSGMLFTVLAILFTGILVTQIHFREIAVVGITMLLALLTWIWARRGRGLEG